MLDVALVFLGFAISSLGTYILLSQKKKLNCTNTATQVIDLSEVLNHEFIFEEGYNEVKERNVCFSTVDKGFKCTHSKRETYIIRNEEEFKWIWNQVHIKPKLLPEINFETCMVIAAFQGERITGGYSIDVTRISETRDCLYVHVKETYPGEGSAVVHLSVQPYHLIRLRKSDKEIIIKREGSYGLSQYRPNVEAG